MNKCHGNMNSLTSKIVEIFIPLSEHKRSNLFSSPVSFFWFFPVQTKIDLIMSICALSSYNIVNTFVLYEQFHKYL